MFSTRLFLLFCVSMAIVLALPSASTWGAELAYLKLEGSRQGIIKGESYQPALKDAIAIYAVEHEINVPYDLSAGMATGKRVYEPIKLIKRIDKSSPLLCRALVESEMMKSFVLYFFRINDKGESELYYTISLKNAVITSYKLKKLNQMEAAFQNYDEMEEIMVTFSEITWFHTLENLESTDSLMDRR